MGPPRPVRLQEQGRRPAAGHPRGARRLQAGREAADDRHVLREELAEHARLHAAGVHGQHGPDAHAGGQRRLPDDDAGRPLPDRLVAQRHAGVRRGGHAQGDRDGLRRPEAHRRHRPQLRRRGRGLRRDDVEDVRRGRHGRGRGRPLQRLQHELGLVVSGPGRQRRHGVPATTSTTRGAGASRRGTSPTGTATSRRSRGRRRRPRRS